MPPRILSAQKPLNRLAAPTWTTLSSNPACSLSSSAAGPTPVSTPPPTPSSAQSHARVPRVIFSGIQPTGIPHVGNYLGALRNWVDLQKDAQPADELLFSSVGLHALTMPQDPAVLAKERREMLATLVAIGLDPARSVLFRQEDVPEHTQLCWILSCLASFGRLRRITTWKSKIDIAAGTETQGKQASQQEEQGDSDDPEGNLNLGLFSYPVLQAADILLYKATHVPVGEDQIQHLELSRALAKRFNKVHKTRTFPTPTHLISTSFFCDYLPSRWARRPFRPLLPLPADSRGGSFGLIWPPMKIALTVAPRLGCLTHKYCPVAFVCLLMFLFAVGFVCFTRRWRLLLQFYIMISPPRPALLLFNCCALPNLYI